MSARDDASARIQPGPEAVEPRRRAPGALVTRPEHLYKAVGLLFLFALLFHFFAQVMQVLLLVFAAGIVAVALNAVVTLLPANRRVMTGIIGLLIFIIIGAIIWFGGQALFAQFRNFTSQLPQFEAQLRSWGEWLREQTGLNIHLVSPQAQTFVRELFTGGDGQAMLGRARGVLEYLALPLLILFGGLFAVGKPNERLLLPVLRAIPRDRRPAFERMFRLLGVRILGWIKGVLLSMLIVGSLTTAALYFIGVPYALLLGVWAGLLELVPLIGPFVGGLTAVTVAFLAEPQLALWTAIAMLVIQQLESNLITPLVMAEVAEVHPFVTLFAIVLFGSLFGFLGVLLSIPLVLLIWTVLEVLWVERAIDTDEDYIPPVVEE